MKALSAAAALLALFSPAAAQSLEPEQSALLDAARAEAIRYAASLPDFLCTQIVHRSQSLARRTPQSLDTLTIQLSYFNHGEDYKLVAIDGKPASIDFLDAAGAVSTGEFGSRLVSVFHPQSGTGFRWKGWSTLRGRRVARFAYHVAKERSTMYLQYADGRGGASRSVIAAFHGEVLVDAQTHNTLRVTLESEIPAGFPIEANRSVTDYDFADVGGTRYLLPMRAETFCRSAGIESINYIQFRDYRKFQTETNITFAPDGKD
jgi:hypothetical protein